MHTMWKGSISFGLVNIPVRMFAATEDKDIRFKYIHRKCQAPIKYEKVCPSCGEKIGPEDIVRGYEYEPGHFVILEEKDFEAIKPKAGRAIEIIDFVNLKEIDPIFFAKSYYLSPQETGGKAYNLLREAMGATGRIAVARIIIRDKESLAVLRVLNNVLVLETIYYPDEVRDVKQLPGIPENMKVEERELGMAKQLIEQLTAEFEPEKYKDEYREALRELINKKIEGEEIAIPPEAPQRNVIDLMQALQASLQQTADSRSEGGAAKRKGGKKQKAETG